MMMSNFDDERRQCMKDDFTSSHMRRRHVVGVHRISINNALARVALRDDDARDDDSNNDDTADTNCCC